MWVQLFKCMVYFKEMSQKNISDTFFYFAIVSGPSMYNTVLPKRIDFCTIRT